MATLPRVNNSKHGSTTINNISSPFSSSPRKLQQMALPTQEAHDVTSVSGISMKQYEEQLSSLKKDNFNLKLRIYFLEEKLGNGSPPAEQGLLEHNVRLQVEVEELKRQLNDKQELLAAAAEAIDVLENQDSVQHREQENVETQESESAGEYLAETVNYNDMDQVTRLQKENRKALQMIKECMKKIQQQDKQIKKLKLDKEVSYAQVSDSQIEKYEEILKCKDEHIRDLESKVRVLQNNAEDGPNGDSGNLQQLLTRRLQGMAYFLDKLLYHKCVLGEDKKKLAESILEQSLALPVGLKLDESIAPDEFTLDESNLDISQSMRIEELTMMFGHHMTCSDDHKYSISRTRPYPKADIMSESECWSEPDRDVSLARVGLDVSGVVERESASDNIKRSRRSRLSTGPRTEENKTNNQAVMSQLNDMTEYCKILKKENSELKNEIDVKTQQIDELTNERDSLRNSLENERVGLSDANKSIELLKKTVAVLESRISDNEQRLADNVQVIEKMRSERQEIEMTFLETERTLRRAADEATIQASQTALERARVHHDKMRLEKELEETRDKLSAALDVKSQLQIELTRKIAMQADNKIIEVHEPLLSDEDRPTSPDQGIDSDRLSSLEHNDGINLSPRALYEENAILKQKLARTKATLADTLTQLNIANMKKRGVQRAICREIHKTQGVLRKARDHFEHQNQ
ncbi:centrosomin isoform X1 [Leptidea sinapis]|uniref:centrosomin isoform X1 n=1 Tax=Leptidea sinapis TaxID=189913 RepID=UPI002128165E|nr:centrosomin isoform X1 [Leptidea sinapis]